MSPRLALTYSSGGGNGWIGVGWDLEVGAIERNARFGLDYNSDNFILRKDGSVIELVPDSSVNGLYHAKIEGEFNRVQKLTASDGRIYWQVTDRTGINFIYGKTINNGAVSRQDDPSNPDHIFKWCLEQIIDTNGNYMTFSYIKDNGKIYLDRIDYTGNMNNGTVPTNYVKFYREPRTDSPISYATYFGVTTAYRLKMVAVFANNNLQRAYSLSYTYSLNTTRSVLTSVQQFDKTATVDSNGAISGGNGLPPITFQAEPQTDNFRTSDLISNYSFASTYAMNYKGDFDGNGMTEILSVLVPGQGNANVLPKF